MKQTKSLTTKEFQDLYKVAKAGTEDSPIAREKMIKGSLSLVNFVIKKYNFVNMDYDDQFQEGAIALIKAIDGYDGGEVFTAYAITAIQRAISRAYNTNSTIKVSEEAKRVTYYASQIDQGEITFDELSPNIQAKFSRYFNGKTIKEIIELLPKYVALAYADDVISQTTEDDVIVGGVYLDTFTPDFSILSLEETTCIRLACGFDGEPVSLNSIALRLGKSRPWVQRAYKGALQKLREAL